MSIGDRIAPHLPYLRRFARALTGSQSSGDSYVITTLEAIIEDPKPFSTDEPPRIVLYRGFLKVWNSIGCNRNGLQSCNGDRSSPENQLLEAITPRPRQAFLLASVEGFTSSQIAAILNCTEEEVTSLIRQAGEEIAEQVGTDVLIIEDEPLISMDLADLVYGLGHRVTSVAQTHRRAVMEATRNHPGLILADIQLADGSSGLDAVNEILRTVTAPVIFITAFPERLLTGERPEPTFLISKPFEADNVRAIISQALFFQQVAKLPGSVTSPACPPYSKTEIPPRLEHRTAEKGGPI